MDELGDVVIHNPSPNKKIWPFPPYAQIELEYLTPGKLYSVSYLTHGLHNRDLYSGRLREYPGLSFAQEAVAAGKVLPFSLKTSFSNRGNTVYLDVRGKAHPHAIPGGSLQIGAPLKELRVRSYARVPG